LVSRRRDCVREQATQIFRPTKVKIREDQKKLHNEKLHNLYFSNITVTKSKKKEMGGACGRQGEKRNVYSVVVGKHEQKETRLEDLGVDGTTT
jgi:hypothetical protein